MKKENIEAKLGEVEEAYKKVTEQIQQLTENKLRLEGQYSVYKEMLDEEDVEELEEIGD